MRKNLLVVLLISIFFIPSRASDYRPGELIIQLKHDVSSPDRIVLDHSSIELGIIRNLSRRLNIWLVGYSRTDRSDQEILADIRLHPDIHLAQFNHYVELRNTYPDDPLFDQQWNLENTGQTGGTEDADVDAPEAWDLPHSNVTALGDTIIVAVVDNGFDLDHEDLDFWINRNEIPGNGIDDDGNTFIDDYLGWNSYSHNDDITASTHGTHVSGIVGAVTDNGLGVSGVNWNIKIMAIQGSSNQEATVVESYSYAYENRALYNETQGEFGAYIVSTNSSFGCNFGDPEDYPIWASMYDSLGAVGVLSAAATMNCAADVDLVGDMPTSCTSDYLIAVTNMTDEDLLHTGAAWGAESIDLGAPGTDVLSTLVGDTYSTLSGTSMASPHVAGAVALLYSAAPLDLMEMSLEYPDSVALMVKNYILDGADSLACLQDITVTGGRLNLFNALELILEFSGGNENEFGGDITEDTVWEADTILVVDDITVADGITLTVQPGVTVQMEDDYAINVQGRMIAEGSLNDTIRFTVNDSLTGSWGGIRFDNTPAENDSSLFSYCLIEKGLADGDSLEGCGGGIMISSFDKVKLENCRLSDNTAFEYGGGIYLNNANIIIENCIISNNLAVSGTARCGGGLASHISITDFRGNEVFNNYGDYAGGGLYLDLSSFHLDQNIISNNFAGDKGGGVFITGSYPFLSSNSISNNFSYNGDELNQGGGLYLQNSSGILVNNLVNNNSSGQGGGLYVENCNLYSLNNTIGVNSAIGADNAGGGFFCITDSVLYTSEIINTIVADNISDEGNQFYFSDEYCYPDIYYSNILGNIEGFAYADSDMVYNGTYENNLDCTPYWQGTGFVHPFALTENSLCINAGTPDTTGLLLPEFDLAGQPRIYDGNTLIIDIGAYEYQGEPVPAGDNTIAAKTLPVLYGNYPNPFNPSTTISFALPEPGRTRLDIFNVKGQLVISLLDEERASGFQQLIWDGKDDQGREVTSGIYFYRLKAGKTDLTRKMMLLK